MRRAIAASGRSRAWVGGQLTPIAALAELFAGRIEISSQHDSQSLLRTERHAELLDRWAGLEADARARRRGGRTSARGRGRARRAARRDARSRAAARLPGLPGAARSTRRSSRPASTRRCSRCARGSRTSSASPARAEPRSRGWSATRAERDAAGAADQLAEAARALTALGALDPELAPLAERLGGAVAEVRDLAADLERHLDGSSPTRAARAGAEERLHRIEQLRRKYGATRRRGARAPRCGCSRARCARRAQIRATPSSRSERRAGLAQLETAAA